MLALLAVAQFMVILDVTVVNVALPSIGADARLSGAGRLQWVVTAYVLLHRRPDAARAAGMADLLGRRTVFLAGLRVFTTASLTERAGVVARRADRRAARCRASARPCCCPSALR